MILTRTKSTNNWLIKIGNDLHPVIRAPVGSLSSPQGGETWIPIVHIILCAVYLVWLRQSKTDLKEIFEKNTLVSTYRLTMSSLNNFHNDLLKWRYLKVEAPVQVFQRGGPFIQMCCARFVYVVNLHPQKHVDVDISNIWHQTMLWSCHNHTNMSNVWNNGEMATAKLHLSTVNTWVMHISI